MDLPAKSRGANIIFKTGTLSDQTTLDFLVSEIHGTVNALLSRTFKLETQFVSISQIYGILWLRQIDVVCEASEPSRKRIKRGEDIGYRQMQRYGKQVYEYVADTICAVNESPTIYINAAVKESSLRSTTELKSVRRNIFNDDDENDLELSQIALHPAVAETLNKFPNKNIKFKLHEMQLVIALFDSIKTAQVELQGIEYKVDTHATATFTKLVLSKYTRYSELVVESIVRWVIGRDVVKKVSGRKISVEFEKDVWGKLMICEMEQKIVSRTNFLKFSFKYLNILINCFIVLL